MISVSKDTPGKLAVRFPYRVDLVTMLHSIPGRKWDHSRRCWVIPEAAVPVLMAKANGRIEVELDKHTQSLMASQTEREKNSRQLAPGIPIPLPPGLSFLPFQEVAPHWVDQCGGRALIADEVGTGKSIEAIGYMRKHPELRPVLILCPATMKGTWERELIKWLPDTGDTIEVLSGTEAYDTTASVIVANYDILFKRWRKPEDDVLQKLAFETCTWDGIVVRGCCSDRKDPASASHGPDCPARKALASAVTPPAGWSDSLAPKLLIVDECQALKDRKTKRAKAAKKLADSAEAVIGLTGTPILNRPVEIYSQLEIINPKIFPSWYGFVKRYCNAKNQRIRYRPKGEMHTKVGKILNVTGACNLDELDRILRQNVMIRRLKRDVLKQLPTVRKATLWVEAEKTKTYLQAEAKLKAKAREYKMVAKKLRARMKGKTEAEKKKILAGAAAEASNFKLKGQMIQEITAMRQEIGLMKYDAVLSWAQEFLDGNPDQKLLVFAWHISMQKKFAADLAGYGCVQIGGGMSHKKRDEAVQRFQLDPKIRAFVLSINAAKEGITLTASSNELVAELPWRPGDIVQMGGRIDRFGQKFPCTQWIPVCADTLEEKIAQLLDSKQVVVAAGIGDAEAYEVDSGILDSLIDELAE